MGKRSRRRGEQPAAGDEPVAAEDAREGGDAMPAPDGKAGAQRLRPDGRLREVSMLVEEADYLAALYRWVVLAGSVPKANDWLRREEWPHPDYVVDVFGSWEKFLAAAELPSSPRVLSYLVAAGMVLEVSDRQALLEQPDTARRLRAEARLLRRERTLVGALRALPQQGGWETASLS